MNKIGFDSNNLANGSTREPGYKQSGETLCEERVRVSFVDNNVVVLLRVEVGSDPNLGDTTLDLVVVGFELLFEGFEALAIEE